MPRAKKAADSPDAAEPGAPTPAKSRAKKKTAEAAAAADQQSPQHAAPDSPVAKRSRVRVVKATPVASEPDLSAATAEETLLTREQTAAQATQDEPLATRAEAEPTHAEAKPAEAAAAPGKAAAAASSCPTSPAFPTTNYALVERLLVDFVAREVRKVGLSRAVLGLSGGVDSAVSAAIAARALGGSNVLGVLMPYKSSSPESEEDARAVAESLGIDTLLVDISAQVDAYFERFPDASRLRRGNKMARERMTVLYDQSAAHAALVIGTSNKTELLLGYGTLYGDMASALNPIGDLYKTQVWGLARHLGLPSAVVEKAPTADLWAGQTDESELGFSYHQVDRLLYWMIDERCSHDELEAMGFERAFMERIARLVRSSQFKRRLPVIAKISARTVDPDFRYSRDWGL